jgi:ABC-2 type transport system ATP-binding protein
VAAIEVTGLERTFEGDVRAVQGVDLEVAEGEIYAFLGPNGAGKTTTVRMLTTLLRPTGGTARVAGHDVVTEAAQVRRAIGVALQEAALDPLMTGRELIQLQATLHGLPASEGRTRGERLLSRVGLVEAADRRVGTYSGGMRRRLDLASALVHEPRVLFLDEPTTGLDPVSRKAIWEEVVALNREGTTVFLTTQYLEEADQLANRVGIIAKGKIVAEGTPAVLKAEVGKPHLEIGLVDGTADRAEAICKAFGRPLPEKDGKVLVELEQGAAGVAAVVRALDDAGILVESLDLVEPTLDDVFVAKTGEHITAEEEGAPAADEADAAVPGTSGFGTGEPARR